MKIDRSILQANDQNIGDFGDPNKLESSISHVADIVDNNDNDVSALKTDNTSNKARLTTVETDIDSLQTDNTSNKSRLTTLETDNTSNKSRIGTLETDNTSIKSRIAANEGNIAYDQAKLDNLLRNTQQASEVVAARLKTDGTSFPLLGDRLNDVDSSLADSAAEIEILNKAKGANIESYPRLGGEVDDTQRFVRAFVLNKVVRVPAGVFTISNLDVDGKTIIGEGYSETSIEGNGDLFVNVRNFFLSGVTLRNKETRGKIISARTGDAIERSRFHSVKFDKANYHVYSDNVNGAVDWSFNHCVFVDAAIVSRYFENLWVYSEFDCYTWYNKAGLQIRGGTSARTYGSVFEYNTDQAIIINANNQDFQMLKLDSTHFEGNGSATGKETILIETITANRIRNIVLNGCSFFFPNQPNQIGYLQNGGGNIDRISFYDCYTKGNLIDDAFPAIMVNVEFNGGSPGKRCIVVDEAIPKRFNTVLAGNDQDQTGAISIKNGETHKVTIGTIQTGNGTSFAYQEFLVGRDNSGTIRSTQVVSNISGVSASITIETGQYRVKNGTGMAVTFQPSITIQKVNY